MAWSSTRSTVQAFIFNGYYGHKRSLHVYHGRNICWERAPPAQCYVKACPTPLLAQRLLLAHMALVFTSTHCAPMEGGRARPHGFHNEFVAGVQGFYALTLL